MANGRKPHRPLPTLADTLKINPAVRRQLQTQGTLGLLDTLLAIAGQAPSVDTLPDFAKEPGLYGLYPPGSKSIQLDYTLPERLTTETLVHEFGHFIGERSKRVPSVRAATRRGKTEGAARPFARAVLALRALGADTTNTEGVLEQFEQGIHPSLSLLERTRGYIPGTQRVLAELLGLPIYQRHPLQPRRQQLLREAGSIR